MVSITLSLVKQQNRVELVRVSGIKGYTGASIHDPILICIVTHLMDYDHEVINDSLDCVIRD